MDLWILRAQGSLAQIATNDRYQGEKSNPVIITELCIEVTSPVALSFHLPPCHLLSCNSLTCWNPAYSSLMHPLKIRFKLKLKTSPTPKARHPPTLSVSWDEKLIAKCLLLNTEQELSQATRRGGNSLTFDPRQLCLIIEQVLWIS